MITVRFLKNPILFCAVFSLAAPVAWSMGGKPEEDAGSANTPSVSDASPGHQSSEGFKLCVYAVGNRSDVGGTNEAARICSSYSADEITCAHQVGNRSDINFLSGLDVCRNESSETITCAHQVGNRSDMNFKKAIPICSKHSEETITCAHQVGNRSDMNFDSGVDFCVKHFGFKPREKSWDKEELSAAVASGEADLGVYEHFRKNLPHAEALVLAKGPVLVRESAAPSFLRRLSKHVYSYDRNYLDVAATLAEKEPRFVLLALRPYLENFPYRGVKDQFLSLSLPVITGNLEEISSKSATRAALRLLVASLQAAMPLAADDGRKQDIQQAVTELGKVASTALLARDVAQMQDVLPRIEAVVSSLVENSYLMARARTDLLLLRYLRGI